MSNNPPEVTIEISRELAEFVRDNANVNITFGLSQLQSFESRAAAEKMVELIKKFKALKEATERALS